MLFWLLLLFKKSVFLLTTVLALTLQNRTNSKPTKTPSLKYLWNRYIVKYLCVSIYHWLQQSVKVGLKTNETIVLNLDGEETECCRKDLRFALWEAFSTPCSITDSVSIITIRLMSYLFKQKKIIFLIVRPEMQLAV